MKITLQFEQNVHRIITVEMKKAQKGPNRFDGPSRSLELI